MSIQKFVIVSILSFAIVFTLWYLFTCPTAEIDNEQFTTTRTVCIAKLPTDLQKYEKQYAMELSLYPKSTIVTSLESQYNKVLYIIFAAEQNENGKYDAISDYAKSFHGNDDGIDKIKVTFNKTTPRSGIVVDSSGGSTSSVNIIAKRILYKKNGNSTVDYLLLQSKDKQTNKSFENTEDNISFIDDFNDYDKSSIASYVGDKMTTPIVPSITPSPFIDYRRWNSSDLTSKKYYQYSDESSKIESPMTPLVPTPIITPPNLSDLSSIGSSTNLTTSHDIDSNDSGKIAPVPIFPSNIHKEIISSSVSNYVPDFLNSLIIPNGIQQKNISGIKYPMPDKCGVSSPQTTTTAQIKLEFTYSNEIVKYRDSHGNPIIFSNINPQKSELIPNYSPDGEYYGAEYGFFPAEKIDANTYKRISDKDTRIYMNTRIDINACKTGNVNKFNSVTVKLERNRSRPYGIPGPILPLDIPSDEAYIIENNIDPPENNPYSYEKPISGTGKIKNIGWFFFRTLTIPSPHNNRCEKGNIAYIMFMDAYGNVCQKYRDSFIDGSIDGKMSFIDVLPPITYV
jgi:hypothetical protein